MDIRLVIGVHSLVSTYGMSYVLFLLLASLVGWDVDVRQVRTHRCCTTRRSCSVSNRRGVLVNGRA